MLSIARRTRTASAVTSGPIPSPGNVVILNRILEFVLTCAAALLYMPLPCFSIYSLNQNRQDWYTMANLLFEYGFLTFRTIQPLLVLIRVLLPVIATMTSLAGSAS